jgi:hypothetical protein
MAKFSALEHSKTLENLSTPVFSTLDFSRLRNHRHRLHIPRFFIDSDHYHPADEHNFLHD